MVLEHLEGREVGRLLLGPYGGSHHCRPLPMPRLVHRVEEHNLVTGTEGLGRAHGGREEYAGIRGRRHKPGKTDICRRGWEERRGKGGRKEGREEGRKDSS